MKTDVGVAYLRTPVAVRARCESIYKAGVAGQLAHFALDLAKLPAATERVVAAGRSAYPDLDFPVASVDENIEAISAHVIATLGAPTEHVADKPDHDATWPHRLVPSIEAGQILKVVLDRIDGDAQGDVGKHGLAVVPLHERGLALSFACFAPIERAGYTIAQPGALPGLANAENGGLFVDAGVLVPKYMEVREIVHARTDEVIVEWRALTITLLDILAVEVRRAFARSSSQLPLANLLTSTAAAGRAIARELRPTGAPPIRMR